VDEALAGHDPKAMCQRMIAAVRMTWSRWQLLAGAGVA
jgi:hypothetical protein